VATLDGRKETRTATGSSRHMPYLPFALLVLLPAVGAAVAFGHL
jgi:hypothetical protein